MSGDEYAPMCEASQPSQCSETCENCERSEPQVKMLATWFCHRRSLVAHGNAKCSCRSQQEAFTYPNPDFQQLLQKICWNSILNEDSSWHYVIVNDT